MKRLLILIVAIVLSYNITFSQNYILYVFSDDIENQLERQLNSFENPDSCNFYCVLERSDTAFGLTISCYKKNTKPIIPEYIEKSNRKVLVNQRLIPLIFDYDSYFATTTPLSEIGEFKKREATYVRSYLINEGPKIIFDKKKIISNQLKRRWWKFW